MAPKSQPHAVRPRRRSSVAEEPFHELARQFPVNAARQHHAPIPHKSEQGYALYLEKRRRAMRIEVHHAVEEMGKLTGIQYVIFGHDELILRMRSQSKLSQQELLDLQKATHFDKKELQQWYKGKRAKSAQLAYVLSAAVDRLPQGLSVRNALERRVPENLQTVLSIRRPFIIRRLCLQRVRRG